MAKIFKNIEEDIKGYILNNESGVRKIKVKLKNKKLVNHIKNFFKSNIIKSLNVKSPINTGKTTLLLEHN